MGLRAWLFGAKPSIAPAAPPPPSLTETLLSSFLANELNRKKIDAEIEGAQAKLKLETLKVEMENLALTQEEKRKDLAFKADLRAKQREWQANHRARAKVAGGKPLTAIPPFMAKCEDCQARIENRKPRHDNDMLIHATRSHEAALDQFFAGKASAASASTNLPN